jgi:hypothetical protein
MRVSMLEVYNEAVFDLLAAPGDAPETGGGGGWRAPKLELHVQPMGGWEGNLTVREVASPAEVFAAWDEGARTRGAPPVSCLSLSRRRRILSSAIDSY